VNRLHLYVLASVLSVLGLALFLYKAFALDFPLAPKTKAQVWNVEARVSFLAQDQPAKVSLFIPTGTRRFAVVDEHFISSGYGLVAGIENGNRQAIWSIRKARGRQSLYYQSVVRRVRSTVPAPDNQAPEMPSGPRFQGPKLAAANALIEEIRAKSADTPSFVAGLLKKLYRDKSDDNVQLLLGATPSGSRNVAAAVRILQQAGIPARMIQGIRLEEEKQSFTRKSDFLAWLEVFDAKQWRSYDPATGMTPVPDDWMRWWTGSQGLVRLEGGIKPASRVSVSPKVEEGISAAVSRGRISKPLLLKFSMFSLPVNTQAVFRVMFLLPVGAFMLVIFRNVVGIKTFGTFMPVLIALAFRETGLPWGIFLFTLVVSIGLSVRFYLERLKLLVVPRLSAILIVVVLAMAGLSIISHNLGMTRGLSVALFPMVIITMIIERMSILWEERGSTEALISGLGSLLTAALAFLVMNIKLVEHLVFVFPELLLVLLALTLLMGRYSGYRLMDLYRFRVLARG